MNAPSVHPFLDSLGEDVTMTSSALDRPVVGREAVLAVVKAGAALYRSQTPTFLHEVGNRRFFAYDLQLVSGLTGKGLVSIALGRDGTVEHLDILFSPLSVVRDMAAALEGGEPY